MYTYSISWLTKIITFLVFIAFLIIPAGLLMQTIKEQNWLLLVLVFVLFAFLIYLIRTLVFILREKFNRITIDHENKCFYLVDKKKLSLELPFGSISCVEVIRGEIIRGIVLGQINLHTDNGTVYRLTVSGIDTFVHSISKDLTVDFKENIFFLPK